MIFFLLLVVFIIPICAVSIWFVLANKASDEQYERELDQIYGRNR